MKKDEIRKIYIAKRKQLSADECAHRSDQIAALFFEHTDLTSIQFLHIFIPITRMNEVNTWKITEKIWSDFPHIQMATSITKTDHLEHVLIDPTTTFEEDKWGIPIPVNATPIPANQIDMVLVPLLAIDSRGHRVGYGKGYYDGFLAECKKDVQKMGISIFPILDQNIEDTHSNDIPLSGVITPESYILFDY